MKGDWDELMKQRVVLSWKDETRIKGAGEMRRVKEKEEEEE